MKRVPLENINVGDSAEIEKKMKFDSVKLFSDISEDRNPVHLDSDYAEKSRYKKQIIHGMMASSLFSGLFGMKLPGEGCIYKSQNIRFMRAIYIGDTVLARIEVTEVNIDKKIVKFKTRCYVNSKVMIDGESEIFVP